MERKGENFVPMTKSGQSQSLATLDTVRIETGTCLEASGPRLSTLQPCSEHDQRVEWAVPVTDGGRS
eukprot:6201204-Pleurochrysis_carterae.AAC.4